MSPRDRGEHGASAASRAIGFLLRDPRVVFPMAGFYVLLGLLLVHSDYTLNDEGLCTYIWANLARREPLALFFLQKAKPVISALYLPVSAGGPRVTLAAHVFVASLSVPLLASTGRKLGLALPNLPPLIVALSPLYFLGGASGLSNVDGIVGSALVLYLLVVRRSGFLAGLVLGALPWVRHELGLFVIVMGLRMLLVDRSLRQILGALAFPVFYTLTGAIYHRDALWLVHFPPTTIQPMPGNPIWEPVTWTKLLETLLSVTPVIGLSFCVPPRRLTSVERTLFVYVVLSLTVLTLLPIWRIANFGFVPRYSMQVLPAVALLTARAVEPWWEGIQPSGWDFLVPMSLCALWCASGWSNGLAVVPAVIGCGAALFLAVYRKGEAAAAAVAALVCVGPALPIRTEIPHREQEPALPAMAAWLRENRDRLGGPVYTNSHLLAYYLGGAGDLPGVDVRFLMGPDMTFDLRELVDAKNGQREALLHQGWIELYGRGVLPEALGGEAIQPWAFFVLRDDDRIQSIMAEESWAHHLSVVASGPHFRVMQLGVRDEGPPALERSP